MQQRVRRAVPGVGPERRADAMSWFRRALAVGPDRDRIDAVVVGEVSAATFSWEIDPLSLALAVHLEGFRVQDGRTRVKMFVNNHGLNFVCVMEGEEPDAVLSLSNICIAAHLRRRGLARAVLASCVTTFQHAAFGRSVQHQRVHLEGYFIGDGQGFSRAACCGVQPTPDSPALVDARWMQLAGRQLRMITAPLRLF